MNFTREPIIETIITPKEGFKLAIRNSKSNSQEEFFVDAVEVVSFGNVCFYRSLERPKSFLVPVSDYEVLEVREARIVLKSSGVEKIKIGGGREAPKLAPEKEQTVALEVEASTLAEQKIDKRRERRRYRKKRGRSDESETTMPDDEIKRVEKPSLIPPPPTLISETLARYKETHQVQSEEEPSKPENNDDKEEVPLNH